MTNRWLIAFLAALLLVPSLGAQDKDEDISPELKAKYEPLFNEFQQSFEASRFDQALKQILAIRKSIEKDVEPTHVGALMANIGVATTYAKLKRFKEAEPIFADLLGRLQKKKLTDTEKMAFVLESQRDYYQMAGNKGRADAVDAQFKKLVGAHPEWNRNDDDPGKDKKDGGQAWEEFQPRFNKVFEQLQQGDNEGALATARQNAADATEKFGPTDGLTVQAQRMLAMVLGQQGQFGEAEQVVNQALKALETGGRKVSIETVFLLQALQDVYRPQNRDADMKGIEKRIQALVDQDAEVKRMYLEDQQKQQEKQKDQPPKDRGPGNQDEWLAQLNKAQQMFKEGKQDEAVFIVRTAIDKARNKLPPDAPFFRDAEASLEQFERDRRPPPPPPGPADDPMEPIRTAIQKANDLRNQGQRAEAAKLVQQLLADTKKTQGDRSQAYGLALFQAGFYFNPESPPDVDVPGLLAQAIAVLEPNPGPWSDYADALDLLARTLVRDKKDYRQGEVLLRKAVAFLEPRGPASDAGRFMANLADVLLQGGKAAEAASWYQKALALDAQRSEPDTIWRSIVLRNVGQAAYVLGKFDEAERVWKQDEALMQQVATTYSDFRPDFAGLYRALVDLYTKTGNAAGAKAYQDKLKALPKP